MKRMIFLILGLACLGLFATPRGLTVSEIPCLDIVSRIETPVTNFIEVPALRAGPELGQEYWFHELEVDLDFRLDARAQLGLNFMYHYHPHALPFNSVGVLIDRSKVAIYKAPEWMRAELSSVLASLDPDKQFIWADLICTTVDPYVDEVAFCVAHSSVQYLNSDFASPQLFLENA